jgi:hypothetical protein
MAAEQSILLPGDKLKTKLRGFTSYRRLSAKLVPNFAGNN